MFIAAGIIAAGVIGGVISHSDHSDYSDYYSDYAEREIKRKKAELKAKEEELKVLKQQLANECSELYETIKSEVETHVPNINLKRFDLTSTIAQSGLRKEIKERLNETLVNDKAELKAINDTIKRINEIQLQAKQSLK